MTVSAFFTILYSFEWGREKSTAWLTSFLLSFAESVILIQPVKVRLSFITPPQTAQVSIVMSVSVCLCVFVIDYIFGTARPIFTKFLVCVSYGRRS